ncbi:autotransporter assembly complex protein TamA [Celerinatantimonas yamalensis]|uniref:Translocation and assembly module subunit TamA n=1 Tax=Celerinatantimonas yamalensis TaxID=559956 RepID=A0ABW9G3U3_9GAMM
MRRVALLVWLVSAPLWAGVRYNVDGGNKAQRTNVEAFLQSQTLSINDSLELIRRRSEEQANKALEALGYFTSENQVQVQRDDQDLSVRVHLNPGKAVVIHRLNWQVNGAIKSDSDFAALRTKYPLQIGGVFNSEDYEQLKSAIDNYASSHGYFDGHFIKSRVNVTLAKHQADIILQYDSGERYRFGRLDFVQANMAIPLVRDLAKFKSGQPYTAQKVADFSQSLNQTGYFRSVLVTPELEQRHNGQIDIKVSLERKPANIFGVGLGYSTDQGVKGKLKWNHPWVNRYGHQFNASIEASKLEQTIETEYRIPIGNPISDFVALQTGYNRQVDNDTDSRTHLITLLRQWDWSSIWTPQIFFKTLYEDYRQGSQNASTLLFMPGFSVSRLRSLGPQADPYWGDSQQLTAQVSSPLWFSDVALTKIKATTKWLRSYHRNRLIVRATGGVIIVNNIDDVPASMRFFAGGDQSIRGYGYKTISPKDSAGKLVGGKYLLTGSVEYDYQFAQKWRVALFYDTGTAANDFSQPLYAGTGVGIRWLTPIGPVRIDLAKPLVDGSDSWRIHFSLGPDL